MTTAAAEADSAGPSNDDSKSSGSAFHIAYLTPLFVVAGLALLTLIGKLIEERNRKKQKASPLDEHDLYGRWLVREAERRRVIERDMSRWGPKTPRNPGWAQFDGPAVHDDSPYLTPSRPGPGPGPDMSSSGPIVATPVRERSIINQQAPHCGQEVVAHGDLSTSAPPPTQGNGAEQAGWSCNMATSPMYFESPTLPTASQPSAHVLMQAPIFAHLRENGKLPCSHSESSNLHSLRNRPLPPLPGEMEATASPSLSFDVDGLSGSQPPQYDPQDQFERTPGLGDDTNTDVYLDASDGNQWPHHASAMLPRYRSTQSRSTHAGAHDDSATVEVATSVARRPSGQDADPIRHRSTSSRRSDGQDGVVDAPGDSAGDAGLVKAPTMRTIYHSPALSEATQASAMGNSVASSILNYYASEPTPPLPSRQMRDTSGTMPSASRLGRSQTTSTTTTTVRANLSKKRSSTRLVNPFPSCIDELSVEASGNVNGGTEHRDTYVRRHKSMQNSSIRRQPTLRKKASEEPLLLQETCDEEDENEFEPDPALEGEFVHGRKGRPEIQQQTQQSRASTAVPELSSGSSNSSASTSTTGDDQDAREAMRRSISMMRQERLDWMSSQSQSTSVAGITTDVDSMAASVASDTDYLDQEREGYASKRAASRPRAESMSRRQRRRRQHSMTSAATSLSAASAQSPSPSRFHATSTEAQFSATTDRPSTPVGWQRTRRHSRGPSMQSDLSSFVGGGLHDGDGNKSLYGTPQAWTPAPTFSSVLSPVPVPPQPAVLSTSSSPALRRTARSDADIDTVTSSGHLGDASEHGSPSDLQVGNNYIRGRGESERFFSSSSKAVPHHLFSPSPSSSSAAASPDPTQSPRANYERG